MLNLCLFRKKLLAPPLHPVSTFKPLFNYNIAHEIIIIIIPHISKITQAGVFPSGKQCSWTTPSSSLVSRQSLHIIHPQILQTFRVSEHFSQIKFSHLHFPAILETGVFLPHVTQSKYSPSTPIRPKECTSSPFEMSIKYSFVIKSIYLSPLFKPSFVFKNKLEKPTKRIIGLGY